MAEPESKLSSFGLRHGFTLIAWLCMAVALVLIAVPLLSVVYTAFAPANGFWALWTDTLSRGGFGIAALNTIIISIVTVVVSVPVGTLFAWLIERTDARMGVISRVLPVIPLMLPPVAFTIGWLFLADQNAGFIPEFLKWVFALFGLTYQTAWLSIYSWPGLCFLYIMHAIPTVYLITAAALGGLDPSLEEAARISGSGRFKCFYRIALPAIPHAVAASVFMCILSCLGLYSIPALIGTTARIDVLSVYIYRLLNTFYPAQVGQAAVVALVVMSFVLLLWIVQNQLVSRRRSSQIGGMGVRPNLTQLHGWKWPARLLIVFYIILTSVLPLVALIIVSMQKFWSPRIDLNNLSLANLTNALLEPRVRQAIFNSFSLAVVCSVLLIVLALILAIFAKDVKGVGRLLIAVTTKLPSAIPNIIIAVAVLLAFGFAPFNLTGTWFIILICYVPMFIPTASLATESAAQQVGGQLVEASRIYGASRTQTLRRIELPLMMPGLVAGAAMIFTTVIGEINAAAILSGPQNSVIGYLIINIYDSGTYAQLASLGTLIGVTAAVIVSLALIYSRPKFSR